MNQTKPFILSLITIAVFMLNSCDSSKAKTDTLIKRNIENMIFVKGGTFLMGDVGTEITNEQGETHHLQWSMYWDDNFIHKVTLSSFWMSKYETTFSDYDLYSEIIMKEKLHSDILKHTDYRAPNKPAGASWYQANEYCQWLAKETGLPFALPTEAQWEYASRNRGKPIGYATDDGSIKRGINYTPNVADVRGVVGRYPPNPLGIYDLAGNNIEWVNDWYDELYYEKSPEVNPQGPATGTQKVARFGDHLTTIYARAGRDPNLAVMKYGFRCVLNAETLEQ